MIQPIRNNVLIKFFDGDNISDGGIIVPGSFKKTSNKGEVIAAGKGKKGNPMQFKKGDIVFRVKDHGEEIHENGEKYFIMDQGTILAYN